MNIFYGSMYQVTPSQVKCLHILCMLQLGELRSGFVLCCPMYGSLIIPLSFAEKIFFFSYGVAFAPLSELCCQESFGSISRFFSGSLVGLSLLPPRSCLDCCSCRDDLEAKVANSVYPL